jgi:Tol biopolymer transport system component
VLPGGDSAKAKQITPGGSPVGNVTPLGKDRILYQTEAGGLFMIPVDGGTPVQIGPSDRRVFFASGCGDGKHIVYQKAENDQSNIWRMDADGTNSVQLTHGKSDGIPNCSSDGQWIAYSANTELDSALISINGGTPQILHFPGVAFSLASLSPDSKLALQMTSDPANMAARPRMVIAPVSGGPPIYSFERMLGTGGFLRWAPDGRGIDFAVTRSSVSNFWRQPLPGGAPKQLTQFSSELIFGGTWSGDGKSLVLARGIPSADIVLLNSGKNPQ